MIPSNCLVYDIECSTNGHDISQIDKHKLIFFGAYSYRTKEYYFYEKQEFDKIQELIASHKFLIGFNNKQYDNPILIKEGYDLDFKIMIDLFKIIHQRMGSIKFKGSQLTYHLKSLSLDNITKTLGLVDESSSKISINYETLNKENLSVEEMTEWKKYTLRDIEITKKLWEWLFNHFDDWKYHLDQEDVKKLKHITAAPSVYAYKVICNKTGLKEEYADTKIFTDLTDGAYVAYPAVEKLEGNIYCLDFASLYPHIMIQCNLFGRERRSRDGWNGKDLFNPMGIYNDKEMSKVSKALLEIYVQRKQYKKQKDPREYGLKITMNTIYGLLRNNLFKNVYDDIAGNDCCVIAQEFIKHAIKVFKQRGYNVFYCDTDSVYLEDVYDNEKKMLDIKDEIIKDIKDNVPFPVETFDMDIDYDIDFIHFFKGEINKDDDDILDDDDKEAKKLSLLKKNYVFVYKDYNKDGTHEKKVFVKNLGIVKRSNSDLSKKIFWERIAPLMLENHQARFSNTQIQQWIKEYLDKDIGLIAKRISVKNKKSYKSESCINVQVHDYVPKGKSHKLGTGNHFLIPNKSIGVGKGFSKYCTLEEYNEYLNYDDLNLDVVMKELHYFNYEYRELKTKKEKESILASKLRQMGLWE